MMMRGLACVQRAALRHHQPSVRPRIDPRLDGRRSHPGRGRHRPDGVWGPLAVSLAPLAESLEPLAESLEPLAVSLEPLAVSLEPLAVSLEPARLARGTEAILLYLQRTLSVSRLTFQSTWRVVRGMEARSMRQVP
jgi:hypothetical protein